MNKVRTNSQTPRISVWGERTLVTYLNTKYDLGLDDYHFFNLISSEIGNPTEYIDNRHFRQGKLTKRIRGFCKSNGIKLDNADMSFIGNVMDNYVLNSETYYLDYQYKPYDKWDGRFGDKGSCFYDYGKGALYGLQVGYGYGVEFYYELLGKMKPYGRMLVEPIGDNSEVIFNGYCVTGASNPLRLLANIYTEYKKQTEPNIKIRIAWNDDPNINMNYGFIIGTDENDFTHTFDLQSREYVTVECKNCNTQNIAFDGLQATCEKCGEVRSVSDFIGW